MSETQTPARLAVEAFITLLLGAIFVWAWVEAVDWPLRTALAPRSVVAVGGFFCVLKLGIVARDASVLLRTPKRLEMVDSKADPGAPVPTSRGEAEESYPSSLEYVFDSASGREWAAALGWIGVFYGLIAAVGLKYATPVFAVLYLRWVARARWVSVAIYAFAIWLLIHGLFGELLRLRLPVGRFL